MGTSYSFPCVLADATAEQVGAAASSLGGAFEEFGAAIVYNGVGGEDLADEEADLQVRSSVLYIYYGQLAS